MIAKRHVLGFLLLLLAGSGINAREAEAPPAGPTVQPGQLSEAPASPARIDTLLRQAAAAQAQGRLREATAALKEALALAVHAQDRAREALALGSLSDGHLRSRELAEAERFAEQAVAVARQAAAPLALAAALNHRGNAWMAQERAGEALTAYQEAILLAKPDPALTTVLLINALHAQLATNNRQEALATLPTALALIRDRPVSPEQVIDLLTVGHLAQRLAAQAPAHRALLTRWAYEALTEAQALAETFADTRAVASATGYLGELYAAAGRGQEAERLFRQALFHVQGNEAPELAARWQWQLGRLFRARQRPQAAKAAYQAALAHLETIEPALLYGQRGNPQFFRQNIRPVYLELVELWLEEARQATAASPRRHALRQARAAMEAFKTAELKNYFRDECVAAQQERNQGLALDRLIPPGTAVLYPLVLEDRLVLLVSLADGTLQPFEVPVRGAELQATAAEFRRHLDRAGNPRRLRLASGQLYAWLIKPLEPTLTAQRVHTLVVVPDDWLRAIPFAALHDGQGYLIQRYALAITPGLSLTDTAVFAEADRPVLVGGLSEPVQGFSALPHVPAELDQVATLYDSTRLVNTAFRKSRLQAQLEQRPYAALLLATHSHFSGDPRQSFLLTYDAQLTLDELEGLIHSGPFRDRPVELVVLSACETAQGDERAALGLAGAAVKAGVSSVVASLWAVNDVSTAQLIPTFFKHLKNPDLSKAQALQQAQQQLLAQPPYQHPFHWAPFVLIGNWF